MNAIGRILTALRFPSKPKVAMPQAVADAYLAHIKIADGMAMIAAGYLQLSNATKKDAWLVVAQFAADSANGHVAIANELREQFAEEMP